MNERPLPLSRRHMLRSLGLGLASLPFARALAGCSPTGLDGDASTDASSSTDTSSSTDAGSTADALATDAGAAETSTGVQWASGTTSLIQSANYPDPFTGSTGTTCSLHCQTTIGPCHTVSPEREDVSDNWQGLPMRMSLRVLNDQCQPVPDAIVEIWHTNYKGIYSGNINTMCNSDAADRAAMYFRGYQRTDANGRVNFNSIFPGWYRGRAVHVHVRVMTGTYQSADNATASVITQLLYTDSLIQSIFASEPLYSPFGQPDTLLGTDNVVGSATDKTPYLFDITKMSDGVMLASKTLIIRSSSSSTLCSLGSMGGGPGG